MRTEQQTWLLNDSNVIEDDLDDDLDNILFDNVLARSKNKQFLKVIQLMKEGFPLYKTDLREKRQWIKDLNLTKLETLYISHLRTALFKVPAFRTPISGYNYQPPELDSDQDRIEFMQSDRLILYEVQKDITRSDKACKKFSEVKKLVINFGTHHNMDFPGWTHIGCLPEKEPGPVLGKNRRTNYFDFNNKDTAYHLSILFPGPLTSDPELFIKLRQKT